jgi:hypothetical protein
MARDLLLSSPGKTPAATRTVVDPEKKDFNR